MDFQLSYLKLDLGEDSQREGEAMCETIPFFGENGRLVYNSGRLSRQVQMSEWRFQYGYEFIIKNE